MRIKRQMARNKIRNIFGNKKMQYGWRYFQDKKYKTKTELLFTTLGQGKHLSLQNLKKYLKTIKNSQLNRNEVKTNA